MKPFLTLSLALIGTGLVFTAGCSKKEEAAPPPAAAVEPAAEQPNAQVLKAVEIKPAPAEKLDPQVQAQIDNLRAATEKSAANATAATANLNPKTQAALDNIKKLLAENNWADALKALNDLPAEKVTPSQQAAIETLKQQAQKLAQQAAGSSATDKGAKALGDLFPKK